MKNKKYAIVSDFDGTVTMEDIANLLVAHYKVDGIDTEPVHQNDDHAKNWMRRFMGAIKTTKKDFEAFLHSAAIERPGFVEMVQTCFEKDAPFEIVSGGMDIYINPILQKFGVTGVPVYAANAEFLEEGIKVEYPLLEDFSLEDFKAMRVRHYQNAGYHVIFCGDGATDFKAALQADTAYARDTLLRMCVGGGISVKELITFEEIIKTIKE